MADLSGYAHRTPVITLSDTEPRIDMAMLRAYRLGRFREQLKARDYGAAIIFDPLSIRYVTGSRFHSIFQTHIPGRYLFVGTEGPVILFDDLVHSDAARALDTIDEVRAIRMVNFFCTGDGFGAAIGRWTDEMMDLIDAHAGADKRVALDRLDPRAVLAFAGRGVNIFDVHEPLERARAIKSGEEILCMNYAIATAEIGGARMREALEPGMTENELWAILHETNIAMGGEWIEARLLSAGDRTNPWLQETSDRVIRAGELVAYDTDMVGPLGYCADISRTYYCGPGRPTPAQRDLYKLALEEIDHNMALIKPGLGFREFTEKHWKQPAQYVANRYPFITHGIGMSDEWPGIYYRQDYEAGGYDGVIEENMTLCVESYMGAEGGHEGVKLERQVLVTANGALPLDKFPFEDDLMA